ncbi:hypothetical protein JZU48_05385 [bacterium]|nr:hypothetical protein [bacterium]
MREYWVDHNAGGRTMLRLGGGWPESGKPAYAGASKGWAYSPYVSWSWTTVAFSEQSSGIFTAGLESCSAVVYLFGPNGGGPTHAALWHVNCSSYEGMHSPGAALEAVSQKHPNTNSLKLIYAVLGFNGPGGRYQPGHRAEVQDSVRDCIRTFANLFRDDIPEEILHVYVGSDEGSFGVSAHGYVGRPMAMVTDGVMDKKKMEGFGPPQPGSKPDSKCYLTTAACRSLGWDDDCRSLARLRWYRDNVLSHLPDGKNEIAEYYRTAPSLVAAIDRRADAPEIYRGIYEDAILPAVTAIDAGAYDVARDIYRGLVRRLQSTGGLGSVQ